MCAASLVQARMAICMHARMAICMHARMAICMHARMAICMHARMAMGLYVCMTLVQLMVRRPTDPETATSWRLAKRPAQACEADPHNTTIRLGSGADPM